METNKNYLQEKTIKEFYEAYDYPTLCEVAKITGIQQTRVFRLSNGSKMKLEEYEIFINLISKKKTVEFELTDLILKFETIASRNSINQISKTLKRNIKVWELQNNINKLA